MRNFMFELKHVTKKFKADRSEFVTVLKNVSLCVSQGEILGLIGLSGAGKSTALRMFNFLENPDEGLVFFKGLHLSANRPTELRGVRQKIGMIFQQFNLLTNKTVFENVAFPLIIARWPSKKIKIRVLEVLELVQLAHKANSYPHQLSGGQKQRVAIARSVANHPDLLLADEPTSALDPITTIEILDCLTSINKEFNLSIIIATHEMNVVRRLCHRVALLDQGMIIEDLKVSNRQIHSSTDFGKKLLEIT